jgi:hypothetical protein
VKYITIQCEDVKWNEMARNWISRVEPFGSRQQTYSYLDSKGKGIIQHHTAKAHGGVETQLLAFFISEPDGAEWVNFKLRPFYPRKMSLIGIVDESGSDSKLGRPQPY